MYCDINLTYNKVIYNYLYINVSYVGERACPEPTSCIKGIVKDSFEPMSLWKDVSCNMKPFHSLLKRCVNLSQILSVAMSTSAHQNESNT